MQRQESKASSTPSPTPDAGTPTTSILSPLSGTQFNSTTNITITAAASDPDGVVTKVEFYSGTTLLATDTSAPYSCAWSNVAAGTYTLTAKATDNSGKSARSSEVRVEILKKSSGSVNRAKKNTQAVSNQISETLPSGGLESDETAGVTASATTQLDKVVSDIRQAYDDFVGERATYAAAGKIDVDLQNALSLARAAQRAARDGQGGAVKVNLRSAIDYLELASAHMLHGNVPNPAEVTDFFIRQNYVDFLNREPDVSGLAFWVGEIESCGADASCRQVKRVNVSAAFFLSIEFQETGYLVHRLHKASYGRAPLLAELSPDAEKLGRGVIVGAPRWSEKLQENKAEFYRQWTQRPDFAARYGGLTNAQFVDALITNAGVMVSDEERASWVAALDAGQQRDYALRRMVEHGDFVRGEYATAFVMMQYMGYLRRDPDAGGFNFWLTKLNEYGGDYNRAEMVRAFIESIEYNDRFRNR